MPPQRNESTRSPASQSAPRPKLRLAHQPSAAQPAVREEFSGVPRSDFHSESKVLYWLFRGHSFDRAVRRYNLRRKTHANHASSPNPRGAVTRSVSFMTVAFTLVRASAYVSQLSPRRIAGARKRSSCATTLCAPLPSLHDRGKTQAIHVELSEYVFPPFDLSANLNKSNRTKSLKLWPTHYP